MSLIRANRHPSRAQLAVFGAAWLVFFGCLAGFALCRGWQGVAAAITALAVVVPAVGWLAPRFMRIVYLGMILVTFPIGAVLSLLILAAVYYLLLTPIGLLARLFGHDPMKRRFDPAAESYWVAREPERDLHRYFRQF